MAIEIERVFFVMMENRSFDHMLGYLHARDPRIEGIKQHDQAWLNDVANHWNGQPYPPKRANNPGARIAADPPHERGEVEKQLGAFADGKFAMDGFVSTYAKLDERPTVDPGHPPPPMSWFGAEDVPAYDFIARNFAVCDNWYCSVPTGTQPNRLMAMGGATKQQNNTEGIKNQRLVYDWLNETKGRVRWRVYHDGMPFFAIMPKWFARHAIDPHFRDFSQMLGDVAREGPDTFPQVTFIEPTYSADPLNKPNNDDHAPEGIARGQAFIRDVYQAITHNPEIFAKSITIITYDEHGGFFDHVSPPRIETTPAPGGTFPKFESLGPRVPALIISPHVTPGHVCSELLDHCSFLKLLGSLFGEGWGYEPRVNARPVGNVLSVLNEPNARTAPVMPPLPAGYVPAGFAGKKAAFSLTENADISAGRKLDAMEKSFLRARAKIAKLPPEKRGRLAHLFPPD